MNLRRAISILAPLTLLLVGYRVFASPAVRGIELTFRERTVIKDSGTDISRAAQFGSDDLPQTIIHEAVEPVAVDLRNLPTDSLQDEGQSGQRLAGQIDLEVKSILTRDEIAQLQAQALEFQPDRDIQEMRSGPGLLAPVIGTSFDSLDSNECCASGTVVPPDPEMSAGPNHLIAVVNIAFEIYDKSGTSLVGPATLASFFSSLGGTNCALPFDPNTVYDEKADRFMIAADGNGNAYCVGVSQTNDPTGAWWLYEFPTNVGGNFFDYPHAGIGDDAIYMGANMFNSITFAFVEGRVWALDKAAMYAGGAASSVSQAIAATDSTPQPVNLHGFAQGTWPSSGPHYILADRNFNGQTYELYSWNDPFGSNTFTDLTTFNLPATHGVTVGQAIVNIQPIPGQTIEGNDARPLDFEYRNGSGWTAMTVSCNPGGGTVNCIQWAEIDLSTPALVQTGVFASSGQYRYFPDVAANHCNDAAVGYTKSSSSVFPAVWATGRESNDTPGTMQAEVQLKTGELVYSSFDGAPLRWGDYSGMTIDPDGLTFWYFGEYSKNNGNANANWGNYISSMSYPNCTTASIELQKTVGTDPNVCAATDTIDVLPGTDVYYCYEVTNTGGVTLTLHDLVDSELPSPIFSGLPFSLAVGSSGFLTQTVNITQTTINTATWTAYNPGPTDVVTASDTATVTLILEPAIAVDPASLSGAQPVDVQVTHPMTITNFGLADLNWSIFEYAGPPPLAAPPAGATLGRSSTVDTTPPSAYESPADFSEDFLDITNLPGWAFQNNSEPLGSTSWFQGNDSVFPAQAGSPTAYIAANFNNASGAGTISNWMMTPELNLSNGDTLAFWTRTTAGSSWPDRLQVRLSTAGGSTNVGTGANDIGDFPTLLLDINENLSTGGFPEVWTQYTVTLSSIPAGATGRLAFRYFVTNAGPAGSNSNYIGIDTVEYTSTATCAAPSDIPWASADPLTGTTSAGLSSLLDVTFDSTGLSTGIYTGTLCVVSDAVNAPLLAVPLTMTVAAYGVELSPDQAQTGQVGTTVTYTVQITNTGDVADVFDLAASGNAWITILGQGSIALDPGQSSSFSVTVAVPAGADNNDMDTAAITATSQGDPTASADTDLTTTAAGQVYPLYLPIVPKVYP